MVTIMASRAHRFPGNDTPLTGVHGGTANAAARAILAAKQLARDAERYADWERRGKPPSPSAAPRKDRLRPSRGRSNLRARLYQAQDGLCGLCRGPLDELSPATIDHVVPRVLGGRNAGNVLLAHSACNTIKGGRPPTEKELTTLATVNERLKPPAIVD
jgi:5-methylcytosine-specific restriction endonuclease McrA